MTTDFRALVVKQHPKFEHLPDELVDLIKGFAVNDKDLHEERVIKILEKFKKMKKIKQTLFLSQIVGKEFLNFKFPDNGMRVADVFKHQILSSNAAQFRRDVMEFLLRGPRTGAMRRGVDRQISQTLVTFASPCLFWRIQFKLKNKFLTEWKGPNFFINCLNLIAKTNEKSLRKVLNSEKREVSGRLVSHGAIPNGRLITG